MFLYTFQCFERVFTNHTDFKGMRYLTILGEIAMFIYVFNRDI